MHNCIFTAHCTESFCDNSCPILVETSYLLERNGLSDMDHPVYRTPVNVLNKMSDLLDNCSGDVGVYVVSGKETTIQMSDILTYCAICKYWKGNRLHCNVYNLKYAKYLDDLKKSWNTKSEPESLQYAQIWTETSKVLIVSNLDYVNFGDFESQTILNILQTRQTKGLTTIFVTPKITSLVSTKSSLFFSTFKSILFDAMKRMKR